MLLFKDDYSTAYGRSASRSDNGTEYVISGFEEMLGILF